MYEIRATPPGGTICSLYNVSQDIEQARLIAERAKTRHPKAKISIFSVEVIEVVEPPNKSNKADR